MREIVVLPMKDWGGSGWNDSFMKQTAGIDGFLQDKEAFCVSYIYSYMHQIFLGGDAIIIFLAP